MRWLRNSVWLLFLGGLPAQVRLDIDRYPHFKTLFSDSTESRKLACEVRPMHPRLNFGFHFVSGYFGRLPLKHYQGPGHRFAIVVRVTPDAPGQEPTYLSQLFQVPAIPAKSRASIDLDGAFFIGEGGYRVDWVIADRDGQTCHKTWHIEAKPSHHRRELASTLAPGAVAPLGYDPWPGVRPNARPQRLTIYLHVAPLSMRRLKLHAFDQTMLLSSVLSLLQRTDFNEVKIVAFNLDQQRELFRQDHFNEQGFEQLLRATDKLDLLTIPIGVLKKRGGHLEFIKSLIAEEQTSESPPGVVLFLGPTARQNDRLRFQSAHSDPRFFYFQYKPYWNRGEEFPDVLSNAVHSLGGRTFHIYSPEDFYQAIQQLKAAAPHISLTTQAP